MQLIKRAEMLELVQKKDTALRKAIKRGHLPAPFIVGGTRFWDREEVMEALEARRAARDAK